MKPVGSRFSLVSVATTLNLLLVACDGEPPMGPSPGAVSGTESLIAALEAAGAEVVRAEVVPQSTNAFFSVDTLRLTVNGWDVYVWEYPTSAEADAQAALVSPDGDQIGNRMVDWIGPPHFFRGGRIIVLYVGTDESLISLLREVLGPRLAGT